jgi:hypothetical protein
MMSSPQEESSDDDIVGAALGWRQLNILAAAKADL